MDNNRGIFQRKFEGSPDSFQFRNRYYFGTDELDALQKWNDKPIDVYTLLLSTARGQGATLVGDQGPLIIEGPGRGVAFQGHTTATQYDTVLNTGIETVVTTVFCHCRVNVDDPSYAINLKHGLGFRGDFKRLFLRWPAQASNSGRLYVFKFDDAPFQSGASPT